MDKQSNAIFISFLYQFDLNLKDFCYYLRYLILRFGILVHNPTFLTGKSVFFSAMCGFRQNDLKAKEIMKEMTNYL